MDFLKGYRTVIFNCIMAVIGLIGTIFPEAVLPDHGTIDALLGHLYDALGAIVIVGNLLLRAVTTTPVFKKASE